jgi:hypothetical protein
VRLEGLGKLKNIHLIWTRTRDLPFCSIVPEATKLQRVPYKGEDDNKVNLKILNWEDLNWINAT